jgi:hypothetical protein
MHKCHSNKKCKTTLKILKQLDSKGHTAVKRATLLEMGNLAVVKAEAETAVATEAATAGAEMAEATVTGVMVEAKAEEVTEEATAAAATAAETVGATAAVATEAEREEATAAVATEEAKAEEVKAEARAEAEMVEATEVETLAAKRVKVDWTDDTTDMMCDTFARWDRSRFLADSARKQVVTLECSTPHRS